MSGFIGCTAKERRLISDVSYKIDDIELTGVYRFRKREFLSYLYLGETIRLPFTDTFFYNESSVPIDVERILSLYRAFGYPDVKVKDIRVIRQKKRWVNLQIIIVEGDPIIIENIEFSWPQGVPSISNNNTLTKNSVELKVGIKPGDRLELPTIEDRIDSLIMSFKEKGYPAADALAKAQVDEHKRAHLTIEIIPGPYALIGKLKVEGLNEVSSRSVETEVDYAIGKPYSPSLLNQLEQNVYGMDVFSTVEADTADKVSNNGTVDITLRVTETKMQSIKAGASIVFEPTRWEEGLFAIYAHRNLFGALIRLDTKLRVGYAQLPTPFNLVEHGPVVKFEPRFTKKGWLEKRLVWTLAPSIELGVEEGYQFYTPGTHLGVSRFFARILSIELSHRFNFFDFFSVSDTVKTNRTLLGLDYRDPYLLSYLSLDTFLYLTDRQMEPRNGVVLGLTYSIAGGPFGGQYDFHKLSPVLRAYWQIVKRLQLAVRAQTGFILPYGDNPAAPFNMKFYLGGADTVRGWGQRRLSPKTEDCPTGEDKECRHIPIGGNTMILANLELRFRILQNFYLVSYLDMGDVVAKNAAFTPDNWNFSSGGGLRLDTPVGKLRLDIAARINETALSIYESNWAFHLGLGESF